MLAQGIWEIRVEKRIRETPARSLVGLTVKARAAYRGEFRLDALINVVEAVLVVAGETEALS